MSDTIKVTVTNVTDGPKVFNGIAPAYLLPGMATGPIEARPHEVEAMRATDWFKIEGDEPAKAEPVSLTGKSKAELTDIAKAEGVTFADDATNAQIVEAIEAKRKS